VIKKELQPKLYQFGMEAKGDFAYCDIERDLIDKSVKEVETTLIDELTELKNQIHQPARKGGEGTCCTIF